MSTDWQAYLEERICAVVDTRMAAICGLDDGALLGTFGKDLPRSFTPAEARVIIDRLRRGSGEEDIRACGEDYRCLRSGQGVLRGLRGGSPLSVAATEKLLVVAAAVDGVPASRLDSAVEALAADLRAQGT
ncbi:profilin [Streptomyces sp. NPDC001941]|uniref:profilin n=1 Tax=Streptomyces sp. NPDC001941 TaxID=3154659 RepID=UPI0033330432